MSELYSIVVEKDNVWVKFLGESCENDDQNML
jgi:hypothetical protein